MPAAADRLIAAVAAGRPIVVYGDYDADGMTATAIMLQLPATAGRESQFLCSQSHRRRLRTERRCACALLAEQRRIGSGHRRLRNHERERSRLLVSLGLELIITDHHEMAAELPDAAAIVHPRLPGHRISVHGT